MYRVQTRILWGRDVAKALGDRKSARKGVAFAVPIPLGQADPHGAMSLSSGGARWDTLNPAVNSDQDAVPDAMADALPRPDRCIVLVGLMGVGKSTIGRRLAKRLRIGFADSDDEIEQAAFHSISEIFERFGEASFRDGERRVIQRLVAGEPKVIATGGGAFIDAGTRALILDKCIAVWLDADIDTLVDRVERRDHRPLLKGKNAASVLRELAAVRNPIYAEAHIHVRSETMPHERAVERIIDALAKWESRS
jgi:shikimate kinase